MSLSCAQSAYNYVIKYIQERKQFGKPIIDFQAVQIQLAEIKIKLDASRLLLYRAVVNGPIITVVKSKTLSPSKGKLSVIVNIPFNLISLIKTSTN